MSRLQRVQLGKQIPIRLLEQKPGSGERIAGKKFVNSVQQLVEAHGSELRKCSKSCPWRNGLLRSWTDQSCCIPQAWVLMRPPAPPECAGRPRVAARQCGLDTSMTCNSKSAWATSSSVARKAETRVVGSLWMKPTVSERITSRFDGSLMRRSSGSSVANS